MGWGDGAEAFTGQLHEDDIAEVVIVCEPNFNNNVMGSIHPHGALYERPVNVNHSRYAAPSCTSHPPTQDAAHGGGSVPRVVNA